MAAMAKEGGGGAAEVSVSVTGLRLCHVLWSDKSRSRKPWAGRKEESLGLEGERGAVEKEDQGTEM